MKRRRLWLELWLIVIVVATAITYLSKRAPMPDQPAVTPAVTPAATPAVTPVLTPPAAATFPAHPPETLEGVLVPLQGKNDPPALTKQVDVLVETDAGEFTLRIFPEAAPRAAERFLQLIEIGFYEDTPVSRVVPGFVAQFGINPRLAEWKEKTFDDDVSHFQHLPGTVAFAKAGRNTNSTQVFINLTENNRLADPAMNFTVFGAVVEGMENVRKFKQVGDPSIGLDQGTLWADPDYLSSLPDKPTMIEKMTILD